MNNIFFTSDQHFHHTNILKFTKRPYTTVEEMNESFIEWNNNNVKDNDEVWNLGDFSFGNLEQTLKVMTRLKGKQNLILGNHCHIIRNNKNTFSKYFYSIQDMRELKIDKKKLVLCHYPMRSWNNSNYGSYQLHGHLHGAMAPYGRSVDVGIDSPWITGKPEWRPFHFDEISEYLKTQEIVKDYGD